MFRSNTRDRVVKFLEKRDSCFISDLCYLGKSSMQIKYPVVRLIVSELSQSRIVRVDTMKFGNRNLYLVKLVKGGKYGRK